MSLDMKMLLSVCMGEAITHFYQQKMFEHAALISLFIRYITVHIFMIEYILDIYNIAYYYIHYKNSQKRKQLQREIRNN